VRAEGLELSTADEEQELSRLTTLSRTTLSMMRRKGGGPKFAKLGHRIVYRLADVERWIGTPLPTPRAWRSAGR
jgi:predicted DNA-binding transcriptional regulator AlpA